MPNTDQLLHKKFVSCPFAKMTINKTKSSNDIHRHIYPCLFFSVLTCILLLDLMNFMRVQHSASFSLP